MDKRNKIETIAKKTLVNGKRQIKRKQSKCINNRELRRETGKKKKIKMSST